MGPRCRAERVCRGCSAFMTSLVTMSVLVVAQQLPTSNLTIANTTPTSFANFDTEFSVFWSPEHITITPDSNLQLLLTNVSGAGFSSVSKYLFGRINMNLKLVPGDSAGTVTTYYMTSEGDNHDELDFEFLGNSSGQPYILQTNVFANGVGEREQRIFLWFDPAEDFHSYSILWNKYLIIFMVDDVPIRVFKNNEDVGLAYPNQQPMGVYSSLWDGDTWATQGGLIKVNWTYSPFIATFQNYNYDACEWTDTEPPPCADSSASNWWDAPSYQTLSDDQVQQLKKVQQFYMVYDYCTDAARNPTPPPECAGNL